MKWPKLKHPLLCNVILVGGVMVPPILSLFLPALPVAAYIPPILLAVIILSPWIGALWFMISHFAILMMTSMCLEMYQAYLHGRRHFTCSKNGKDPATIRKRILRRVGRFGSPYEVKAVPPELLIIRYKNSPSATVYFHRIEKLLLVYEVEELDKDTLRKLWQSAHAMTNIISKEQKPLYRKPRGHSKDNSVSVAAVILANTVSPDVAADLAETEAKMEDRHVLFCAVELSTAKYYFDNQKEPFLFHYPTKNRVVNLVHRRVFGGRVPLRSNPHMLPAPMWLERDHFDPEDSLWSFMKYAKKELKGIGRSEKKRFQEMQEGTVILDDGWLYCKLGERVSTMMVDDDENDPQKKQVILSLNWEYPKSNRISKKDNATIRALTEEFLRGQGFGVTFVDPYDNE
jgi:hypothetical protein